MRPSAADELVDARAAGRVLGIPPATIHGWCDRGWLRAQGAEVSWPHRTLFRYGDVCSLADRRRKGLEVEPLAMLGRHNRCILHRPNGRDCGEPVPDDSPLPMCMHHLLAAASYVEDRKVCAHCGWARAVRGAEVACLNPRCPAGGEVDDGVRGQPVRDPCVYYMRRGDLIKIGTTIDLRQRVLALLPDELLATEPGHFEIETLRLRQFKAHRARGREWFRASEELLSHIAMLRDHFGEPPLLGPP